MGGEEKQWVPDGGGEEVEYSVLPAGIWDVSVFEVIGEYSKKGIEMLTWVLTVDTPSHVGSKLWHRTSMDERAKSFPGDGFYAVLDRLHLGDFLAGKTLDFDAMASILAEEAPGRKARVSVTEYQWEGKPRNDVDDFWDPEDPEAPECQIFASKTAEAPAATEGAKDPTRPAVATRRPPAAPAKAPESTDPPF